MSRILHAMYAKPFESEFTRQRGRVHTELCDRDNLFFDSNGNMTIGLDGLPRFNGIPQEVVKKRRKHYSVTEFTCQKAIVDALKNGVLHTCTELSDITGFSRCTVAKYLNILKQGETICIVKKNQGNKQVEYFRLSRGYLDVSA